MSTCNAVKTDEMSRRDAIKRIAMAAAWIYGGSFFGACSKLPALALDTELCAAVRLLADVLLPMHPFGPSPSSQKIDDFINEWVSADYPAHRHDRDVILKGLNAWKGTRGVSEEDFIASIATPNSELYPFFTTFRRLVVGGYYTTEAGWNAIGYVGNVTLSEFPGAPAHILKQLGVTYDDV